MTVQLEFYYVEESTGVKTKINDNFDLGSLFKGTETKIPIAIKNIGTTDAVNPKVSIVEYFQSGKDYSEAVTWKKLSSDKNGSYDTSLSLPNIKAGSWMEGKDVYFEDFSWYPLVAGTKPDQNWTTWAGNSYVWEVYSGYLMHNVDTQLSRAMWNVLPEAKDFEFSTKITVRNGVFAGYILRHTGDYDTGYIVLIQGQAQYFNNIIPQNEGVIQVWKGKFTSGIETWTLLYQSGSIGIRGTHDYFKVKLTDNRFDFWYQNQLSSTPLYSFVDDNRYYINPSKPILASHQGSGSILVYFDDIKMEVPTPNGRIWIDNKINKDTKVFGEQISVFKLDYGGV